MRLGAACAAALALTPVLIESQAPNVPPPMETEALYQQDETMRARSPGVAGDQGESRSCLSIPSMPKVFHAKRAFFSLLNTIFFYDQHGHEFGFVQSWPVEWKNPMAVGGATFFLKASEVNADEGLWEINPQPGGGGDLTQVALEDPSASKGTYFLKKLEGKVSKAKTHIPIASMDGKGTWSDPQSDHITIKDCQNNVIVQAHDGHIMFRSAHDSDYVQDEGEAENKLIIRGLGHPAKDLVRVVKKAPCFPFAPFCERMGALNRFMHGVGLEWEGKIIQPGYTDTSGLVRISMTNGASTDMRFLTLFSSYEFSNTRLSPVVESSMFLVLVLCLVVCVRCCCCFNCCGGRARSKVEPTKEETEKLMETVEEKSPRKSPKGENCFMCCTRKGGRELK